MARNSFMQNSFLAGEFSPLSQGRSETEDYYRALNVCLNYIPTDEGALSRRSGTRFSGEARANTVKLIPFYTAGGNSYICEFTAGFIRFHTTGVLVDTLPRIGVISISTATPAVVKTSGAHGFSTGETVVFPTLGPDSGPLLFNRQFRITVIDADEFSIANTGSLGTASVDGSGFSTVLLSDEQVSKVTEVVVPYTGSQVNDILHAEEADNLYLFHPSHEPNILDGSTLTLTEAAFLDGPYLDLNTTTTTLAFSGTTGSVTVTASAALFASTGVGRAIRVNTGTALLPDWSWLKITAFASTTSVTATITGPDLAVGTATLLWRLGVFSNTDGWPSHGVVHDGRLWMVGDKVTPGRVYSSKTFDFLNFEPTAQDGTVADDNGITAPAAGIGRKNFKTLQVLEDGLFIGSDSAEWHVRASTFDDPLTPFTTQLRRQTKYGSADALPIEAGRSTVFIQALGRSLIEYRKEGGKYDGNDLARTGRHLTEAGMVELAYSSEPLPIIWVRRSDQRLIALTYRNDLEGKQAGWHQHNVSWADDPFDATELANNRHVYTNAAGPVLSIAVAPFSDKEATRNATLWAAVLRNGQACIEYLMPIFDDSKDPNQAFHVDSGNAYKQEDLDITWELISTDTYRFYGLDRLVGDTVDLTFRGVDIGSGVVSSSGTVDMTISPDLNSSASAYETSSRTSISAGGLSFSSAIVSEARSNTPNSIGTPCAQSTIIVGEDNKRYYIRGGVAGVSGSGDTVILYDADTGVSAITKTNADIHTDANAAGIVQSPSNGTANAGALAVAIPETPYFVTISGGAGGTDTHKIVVYWKINAASAMVVVGGFSMSEDGLNVQFSPPTSFGSAAEIFGWIAPLTADAGTINTVSLSHPFVAGWYGESRSTLFYLPSINWVIANTPVNETSAVNPWFGRERALSLTSFGANLFNLQDDATSGENRNNGFVLPSTNGGFFCYMFSQADIDAHVAGTETITNTFLDTNASTYSTGLISAVRLFTDFDDTDTLDGNIEYGQVITAFHERFKNTDGTAAYPFPDEGQDFDGTTGTATDNYYCAPTVYPSDLSDPDAPWYLFFYRVFRATGDKDKGGIRVFKWDPKTLEGTYLDFSKGQIFTLTTDVAATTDITSGNVQWNRTTNQLTLLLRSTESGARSQVVTEFGTFDPVTETLTVAADGHIDAIIGLNYFSRGQRLRPDLDSGAQSGGGLGKLRRTDRFSGLFYRTGQIKFGTKFTDLVTIILSEVDSLGRRPLASKVSEIRSLQDSYGYDSMMAFQQDRPDPGGIVALAGHVTTQDV